MKTSYSQYHIMVDFMERNGDLSKPTGGPRGRMWAIKKWLELANKLNSDGSGDARSEEKWRKVWSDYKNNVKKKWSKIKRAANGTGGGPALRFSLTDVEERVLALMGEQAAVGFKGIAEAGLDEIVVIQLAEEVSADPSPPPVLNASPQPFTDDSDWNQPSGSQLPQPPPRTEVEMEDEGGQITIPEASKSKNASWKTNKNKRSTQSRAGVFQDAFLDAENRAREYERERDRMWLDLERERLRQRDIELDLQAQWLQFMNEALRVVKNLARDGAH